jgi:prevent-host-death family protein
MLKNITIKNMGPFDLYNVTEARAKFAELLNENQGVVVTRHGKPLKILVSFEFLEALVKQGKVG